MTRLQLLARSAAGTTTAVGGLTAAAAALTLAGRTLPFPRLTSPTGVLRWMTVTDSVTVAFTAARGIGVGLVGWVALTWLLAVAARLARVSAAVRAADGISLPFVRRLAELTAGVALVAVSLAPAAHAGAAVPDSPALVVMSDLGPTSPGTTTTVPAPPTTSTTPGSTTRTTIVAPPLMTALGDQPVVSPTPTPSPPSTSPAQTVVPASAPGDTWVIHAGDTLWHVAERTATDQLGRPASLAETATQLDRLIALNASRLAVPGDADLVFPGQEFLVP